MSNSYFAEQSTLISQPKEAACKPISALDHDDSAPTTTGETQSIEDNSESLERLVTHFLAAKRALASTSAVYRANDIVSEARHHVEHRAVLEAKNAFIKRGLETQVGALRGVRTSLTSVGRDAQGDFEDVVKSLDTANDRLQVTLASLRKTLVKAPKHANEDRSEGTAETIESTESSKTLYDFIDETTHQSLLDNLRKLIDSYNGTQKTLNTTGVDLQNHLDELGTTLADIGTMPPCLKSESEKGKSAQAKSISGQFHFLVDQATEMANLLQSLISHYDLCITALKHTEGGGEAARLAVSGPNTPIEDGPLPVEESLYRNDTIVRDPISEDERKDMLSILDTDAAQVPDVLNELNDRLDEMEIELEALASTLEPAKTAHAQLAAVVKTLKNLSSDTLPLCPTAATQFQKTWTTIRADIIKQTKDLAQLAAFYENFTRSHSALLREIDRRELVASKIRRIAERARRDITALHAEDEDMRRSFLKDVGEFLPRDIWPDIMTGPERWVIRVVRGDEGEEEGWIGGDGAVGSQVVSEGGGDDGVESDGQEGM